MEGLGRKFVVSPMWRAGIMQKSASCAGFDVDGRSHTIGSCRLSRQT